MTEKLKSESELSVVIATIQIEANKTYIPALTGFVSGIAEKFQLSREERIKLELITEEAALSIIENSFSKGQKGFYEVAVKYLPGKLKICFVDKGEPFDFEGHIDDNENIGAILIKAFADEISFNNLGKDGKEIIVTKKIPLQAFNSENIEQNSASKYEDVCNDDLVYQFMQPEQALEFTQFVFKNYEYNYPNDGVYYPEIRKELLEIGALDACVVLNKKNEIIGHIALKLNNPDSMVGELCEVIIDKKYRSNKICTAMKEFLFNYSMEMGLYGVYYNVCFLEKFQQNEAPLSESVEVAFLLFDNSLDNILYYKKLNNSPDLTIYPPLHHQNIVNQIYKRLNIKRIMLAADLKSLLLHLPQQTNLLLTISSETKTALIDIVEYGNDFIVKIKSLLGELTNNQILNVIIDLPLSNPVTQVNCAILEAEGFFFSGVLPEYQKTGDVLRLQYISGDIPKKTKAVISEFGSELLNYIYENAK